MSRGSRRRQDAYPSWVPPPPPSGPVSSRLGFPADLPYGSAPQGYIPGQHPHDPSRLEHQVPWAPEDPRSGRNTVQGIPPAPGWGDYALTAPEARPGQFRDFFAHTGRFSLTAGERTRILLFEVSQEEEGRLLRIAAQSTEPGDLAVNNLGYDITWELLLNGSALPGRGSFIGGFSSLTNPLPLIVQLPRGAMLELYATSPPPREVQAFFHGWTAPIVRGMGRVSSGIERP